MAKTKEQKYQDQLREAKICSICYRSYQGWGNNAAPINIGTCCDECNSLVIVARLNSRKGLGLKGPKDKPTPKA